MAFLEGLAIGLGLALLLGLASGWPLHWIYARLRRGDYAGAFSRCDVLLPWWPDKPALRYMRGTTLLFAGRAQEAESALRESLAVTKNLHRKAVTQCNLGYALLDQERYSEAAQTFEESIAGDPGSGAALNGLAEVYLRQDQRLFDALRNLDRALELKQGSAAVDRHMLAHMWANRAWALARLGRGDEALAALRNADTQNTPDFLPAFAGAHWRMGMALAALGRRKEALDRFHRASEKDPQGNYGARAARAAQEYGD